MGDKLHEPYPGPGPVSVSTRLDELERKVDRILEIMEQVNTVVGGFGEQMSKSPFLGKMLGL